MAIEDMLQGIPLYDDVQDERPSRKRKKNARKQVVVEDDPSILGSIGSNALSGLSKLANVLDIPGSMIRDTLVGENPLDQLLSPTTDEGRNSGRDVLEKWGALDKNQEGFDAGDVAGFAADVLLDPTTYLTGGATAASKSGKLLKAAGLADNATMLGNKLGLGMRQTQRTKTLREALDIGTDVEKATAYDKATKAAQASGQNLDDLLDTTLGGTHKITAGPVGWAVNKLTGSEMPELVLDAGERYAKTADKIGEAVRYSGPVRHLAALFDARNKGQTSEFGQKAAQLASIREGRNEEAARGIMGELLQKHQKLGIGGDAQLNLERQAAEGIPGADVTLSKFYDEARKPLDEARQRLVEAGLDVGQIDDLYAKYFPRSMTTGAARHSDEMTQGAMELGAQAASARSRKDPLENIMGGAAKIDDIIADPKINEAIQSRDAGEVASRVKAKYGQVFGGVGSVRKAFDDYAQAFNSNAPDLDDKFKALSELMNAQRPGVSETFISMDPVNILPVIQDMHADDFAKTIASLPPDVIKAGRLYGNHPLADMQRRMLGIGRAQAHADTGIDTIDQLLQTGKLKDVADYGDNSKSVGEVMGAFGLKAGDDKSGWVKNLFERTGQQYDPKLAADLVKKRIPEDIAADMLKMADQIKGPKAVGAILEAYDSAKNLSKAHWTGMFPAFHIRNLFSGQLQNMMKGIFSASSGADTSALIRGKDLKGYADLPVIKEMMQQQGISEADALRQLVYQYNLVPKYSDRASAAVTGVQNKAVGDTVADLQEALPGTVPFSGKESLKKLFGRGKESSWKPWDVRGVGGREKTTFNIGQAAEDAGWWTEAMNRISPFLAQIKKGVDPAEAARRVNEAQVSYAAKNYTPFESEVLSRLAPFYKFSKGAGTSLARELTTNPGGPTGQALRAMNRSRDSNEVLPDHISETAAIPLGQAANGDPRYLTGLGLMFEDPAQFFTNPSDAIGELISRSSPVVKVPIEMASGESFFQRGGDGGRPLDEMDPVLGRTLANIKGLATGTEQRDPVPTPQWLEMLLSNSPLARYGSTVRTLSDPRKGAGAKALNTLTGLRVSDVSEAAVDSKSDEIARQLLKELGGREFIRSYIPDERKQRLSPEDQKKAEALVQLMNQLATRAKERKAKREAAKQR
jgi:hypothetical protein